MNFRLLTLLILLVFENSINAQKSIHQIFPTIDSCQLEIEAEDLLQELNWTRIKNFCDSTEGHYARKTEDEHLTTYKYTKQGYAAHFKVTEFEGKVLEYSAHVDQFFRTTYFNRNLWLKYVETDTKFKDSKWSLTNEEISIHYNSVIQAYYTLLGFNSRDEYGWICEYSTMGIPPDKRLAVIDLINYRRRDFLLKLLDHPNPQTKIYVADALIYLDIIGEIQTVRMDEFKGSRRAKRYHIKYSNQYKLSKKEWRKIEKLRDDNFEVITCGNMGSYKKYRSTSKKLLSSESINRIYSQYTMLRNLGYLNSY